MLSIYIILLLPTSLDVFHSQIFRLASLLTKKGWAHSSTSSSGHFYLILQELLSTAISALNGTATLNHDNMTCLSLLVELSRLMTVADTGSLGVSWEEYMDAKKLFEKRILLNLLPAVILLFQRITSNNSSVPLSQLLNRNPLEPFLLHSALEFMEIFVDWEFSYTRCQPFLSNEMWFIPSSDWYSLIFELPPPQTSTSSSGTLFDLLIAVFKEARADSACFSDSAAAIRFRKSLSIFTRAAQFRTTRLESQLSQIQPMGQQPPLSSQEKRVRLTQMIFVPLFNAVGDLMTSSLFVSKSQELFDQPNWTEGRRLGEEEIQSLSLAVLRIIENPDVDLVALMTNCQFEKIIEVLEWYV